MVLQIAGLMTLFRLFFKLGMLLHCFRVQVSYSQLNREHIRKKQSTFYSVYRRRLHGPISNIGIENVDLDGQACFTRRALE